MKLSELISKLNELSGQFDHDPEVYFYDPEYGFAEDLADQNFASVHTVIEKGVGCFYVTNIPETAHGVKKVVLIDY